VAERPWGFESPRSHESRRHQKWEKKQLPSTVAEERLETERGRLEERDE
jgi:hypothetical protein